MTTQRKKLIEVSMPLEAINKASAREKSIRHGHPSTLHLWWARRPLAACRAVLFGQLVDDPGSWPEEFPTIEDQERERARLHRVIAEMVPWKATNDEVILNKARFEIARSVARGRGDKPPGPDDAAAILAYLAEHAPPVCDPFCGGGSIPLEAQRLGLRAYGSDLNPVAVLVSKATCEIPHKFAGQPPVNPARSALGTWKGAQGLAEDIRYYGQWMRDEAEARIGHLYPKVKVTKAIAAERKDLKPYAGKELTVIAWLWARTVASPDPTMRGAHAPLVSSFILSSKKGKEAIVVPVVNRDNGTYRFTVKTSRIRAEELVRARLGTKAARGANFTCLVSGSPIPRNHVKAEGMAGHMGVRLLAVVVVASRRRLYVEPTQEIEIVAGSLKPEWRPGGTICGSTQYLGVKPYGMDRFDQLFTERQLVALSTFSELVCRARERVLADSVAAGMTQHVGRLCDGGTGAEAYSDVVASYLAIAVSRLSDICKAHCPWENTKTQVRHLFVRQAIPMLWDFAEANVFGNAAGDFRTSLKSMAKALEASPISAAPAAVIQQDAASETQLVKNAVVATDPPYYDNVPYADISDFFYVWLRHSLQNVHGNLFRLNPDA